MNAIRLILCLLAISSCYPLIAQNAYPCVIPQDESYLPVDGAELYCKVMGRGRPMIVIHGGAGYISHDYLLPAMEMLSGHNRTLFYDQRGCGKSLGEITPHEINIQTFIDDIDAIRKSLGVEKVSVLGHSWGGFLAMLYAASYPEHVDKLILVSSMPPSSQDYALFAEEFLLRTKEINEEINSIMTSSEWLSGDPDAMTRFLKICFETYLYSPADIEKLNLSTSKHANQRCIQVAQIFEKELLSQPFDFSNKLKNIHCPTLILHGDTDPIPFITAEHLHEHIINSELYPFGQCGHFPFVEQPKAFFEAVELFMERPSR